MQKVYYSLVFYSLGLISLLPFWVLYGISNFFYLIIRLIGYRKDVITENLRYSFPEKSEEELVDIRNKFYRHFSDLFVETIKLQTMSKRSIRKRILFENIECLDKIYDQGRDVQLVTGHYGTWEWPSVANSFMKAQFCAIYKPLHNRVFDRYFVELRSKKRTLNFPMKSVFKDILNLKRNDVRYVLGVIADQTPGRPEIQYVTSFLNQNTPVHMGLEKMAKKFDDYVVFMKAEKIKRGYYKLVFTPIIENPKERAKYEITNIAMKYIQDAIVEKPEYYLWSHKRWKHIKHRAPVIENYDINNE